MHVLSEPDVSQIFRRLSKAQCHGFIETLGDALVSISKESAPSFPTSDKQIHQPHRTIFTTKKNNTSVFMPVSDTVSTGIKIVTNASGGVQGVINIFNSEGNLEGLLAAADITAFRTALATMTLLVRVTTIRKENILVLGSGRQAEWHARLALLLYPDQVRRVSFVNRGAKRLSEMERDVIAELRSVYPHINFSTLAKEGVEDYQQRLGEELAAADVIFSCTPSTEPNFSFADLQKVPKQRFISLIGSFQPSMHEIDTETLLSGGGKVYVDSKSACLEEAGELITAGLGEDDLVEMGDILGAKDIVEKVVDVPHQCNVIYKCVGIGLMDLVVGKKLLDIGVQMGLGTHIDGF